MNEMFVFVRNILVYLIIEELHLNVSQSTLMISLHRKQSHAKETKRQRKQTFQKVF